MLFAAHVLLLKVQIGCTQNHGGINIHFHPKLHLLQDKDTEIQYRIPYSNS